MVYKGTDDKVCIICPKHDEFWQSPHHHLQGQKCRTCVREYNIAIECQGIHIIQ